METAEEFARRVYGDDFVSFDPITRRARTKSSGTAYILDPTRGMKPRHKLMADLAAAGLSANDISKLVKKNPHIGHGGHYNRLLRNPLIAARTEAQIKDVVEQAKETLKGTVTKAAENVKAAVDSGDLAMSKYVLDNHVVEKRASNVNVSVSFGDWLSDVTDSKTIDVTAVEALPEPDIANHPDEVEPTGIEGVRLDGGNFDA